MSLNFGVLKDASEETIYLFPWFRKDEAKIFIQRLNERIEEKPDENWTKHRTDLLNELELVECQKEARILLPDLYYDK